MPATAGLRDSVVKPERLVVALGTMTALHAAWKFDDAAGRVRQHRALRAAGVLELLRRHAMNDEDGVNRRLSASAKLPRLGVALFGVTENSRALASGDAFLELDGERAEHVRRQPEPGKAAGGERDVQRHGRLQFFTGRRLRPRLRRCDGGTDRGKPSLRLDHIVELQEQVRRVRQVAVTAGDEPWMSASVFSVSRVAARLAMLQLLNRCLRLATDAVGARTRKVQIVFTFKTVSSGYALKNTSDGT